MSKVTIGGNETNLAGDFLQVGDKAPNFTLVAADLSEFDLASLSGKKAVLSFFPSVDTGTCATGMRKFNQEAADLENTAIIAISQDLPFAAGRFCGAEGIEAVKTGSTFRNNDVLEAYGVKIAEGALANLSARAVIVIDETATVLYAELVPEVSDEPDYAAALAALA